MTDGTMQDDPAVPVAMAEVPPALALPTRSGGSRRHVEPREPVAREPVEQHVKRTSFPFVVVGWTLASLSILSLWLIAFGLTFSGWNQAGAERRLYAQAREELASQTGPIGGKITPGAPLALLDVPRLDIHDLVVVEGTSSSILRAGPGHRRDTPLPGQPGSSVIMGRSLLFGGPFQNVPDLRKGDTIDVETGQGQFSYVVDGTRHAGDPVPALQENEARLTLVTAARRVGGPGEREALFVDAHLKGTPQEAPEARPKSVDADEVPMAGDRGALIMVFLYLELLLIVVVVVSWAAARWRLRPSLIIGVPLIIASLWLVTDAAARLLPNLS